VHAPDDSARTRLLDLVGSLEEPACAVLLSLGNALSSEVKETIDEQSDIVSDDFASHFRTRLQLHHAVTSEPLKKKTFEYAFQEASRATGRAAYMTESGTHPGHDLTVDGTRYSLKTEASSGIRNDCITISKFQEARWIRECITGDDFKRGIGAIMRHLANYDRIVTLRAFRIGGLVGMIRYDLVEIPHSLLSLIGDVAATDFAPRSKRSGGTSAIVKRNGKAAFRLRLDGSVEKVTLSGIKIDHCVTHATWTVPILVKNGDNDEED